MTAGNVILHIKRDWSYYLFSMILLLGGVGTGTLFVYRLPAAELPGLIQPFRSYEPENQPFLQTLVEQFQSYALIELGLLAVIFVMGITLIGLPVAFLALFAKGMMIGFTTGVLVMEFGFKGVWYAVGVILPQNILLIPAYLLMMVYALTITFHLWRKILIRTTFIQRVTFGHYISVFFIAIVLVLASTVIESIVPALWMKLFYL